MFDVLRRFKLPALLVLVAMFAFSFGDFFSATRNPTDPAAPPVARLFGRELTREKFEQARYKRDVANRFLVQSRLAMGDPLPLAEFVVQRRGFGPTDDEDSIINAIILAHKATELGITCNDQMVERWITQVTDGRLTSEQFRQAVSKLGSDVSPQMLYEHLREQLRIQLLGELALGRFISGATQVTPYETWEFYQRLNDRFALEIIPVPVVQFADEIGEPAKRELEALYHKFIDQLPNPSSPEPGFQEPRKLQLEYAFASSDEFTASWKAEITDEEIREYYESNKESYRVYSSSEEEPAAEQSPSSEAPEEPKESEATSTEEGKGENSSAQNPDGAEERQVQSGKPLHAESRSKGDRSGNEKVQPEVNLKGASKDTPTGDPTPKPPPETSGKGSASQAATPRTPLPGGERGAIAPEATESPEDSEKPDEAAEEPPRYRPLEEVKEEIREHLHQENAREELLRRLEQVVSMVRDFADKEYWPAKDNYEEAKENDPDLKFVAPKPPNFSQKIEELGLKAEKTEPRSLDDISGLPGLGGARELLGDLDTGRSLIEVLDPADNYYPRQFKNFDEEYFVIWKIADQPSYQPSFDKIREDVLAAYRTIQARPLAGERAEQYARELRDMGGDIGKFRQAHPDVTPVSIASTISLWSMPLQLSTSRLFAPAGVQPVEIPGVRFPDHSFREQVFELAEGEVAVLTSLPQDTYYVILVTKREPAKLEDFASSRFLVGNQLQRLRLQEATWRWLAELRTEAGLERIEQSETQ
ncbi:MAG: hypothetical protein ACE5MH_06675 [Terriglobia bacterium]